MLEPSESSAEMEEFASVAAHDLKAPLRAMGNLSQWIEEDLGPSAKPELLANVALLRSRIGRMNRLLDDFLQFARAGLEASKPESIDLNRLVASVISASGAKAGMAFSVAPNLPVVMATAAPLRLLLAELVSNALKHHDKAKGEICVQARELGEAIEISVSDDGPGIDVKDQERIFKLGQTLRPKDETSGNGVGLALLRKMLRHHGGSIHVESTPGEGSCFTATWPKGV